MFLRPGRLVRALPRVKLTVSRGKKTNSFSVDRSGLIGVKSSGSGGIVDLDEHDTLPSESGGDKDPTTLKNKEEASELAKDLISIIGVKGPISLHEYLGQCSNHILYGYYQSDKEKIGRGGDFTTAPEVSQLFGESLGTWCVSHWMALGEPEKINIVELGPGKGTLMRDILNVASKFPKFERAINVSLVELSETMRDEQRKTLDCPEATIPHASASDNKTFDAQEVIARDKEVVDSAMKERRSAMTSRGVPISWHYTLNQISDQGSTSGGEEQVPCLVVAQEFLDVFPVHQFVYSKGSWLEKLVDVDNTEDSQYLFRMVLSQSPTPASMSLLGRAAGPFKDGDEIEVSPVALATCEEIAAMVCRYGGAAVIIDYGSNSTSSDSLRGFQEHQTTSVLSKPGLVDTTADVDFDACGRVAARRGAKVVGAIPQAEFLIKMGVVERAEQLISLESTTEEEQFALLSSLKFLVDEKEMGERFKVMTILDPKLQHVTSHIGFPVN